MGSSSVNARLERLEAEVMDGYVRRMAERIGADPAELLARAREIAELGERIGRRAVTEQLAAEAGLSVEAWEAQVAEITDMGSDDSGPERWRRN